MFKKIVLLAVLFSLYAFNPAIANDHVQNGNYWQSYRFKHAYESGKKANWHMDLMLSQEIIKPVLDKYGKYIVAWRVHRRAADDSAGHLFRFYIYADKKLSDKIDEDIQKNETLEELLRSGDIISYNYSNDKDRPDIEDTSDKNWPLLIQKTWPSYAQGICEMLLEQIDALVSAKQINPDLKDKKLKYQEVNEELRKTWEQFAMHAYYHHLNALYAYDPFNISLQVKIRF